MESTSKSEFSRELLHERHRLSHRQIDEWLGTKTSEYVYQEETIQQLNHVAEFIKITDLFRENDIPFISLKGPLLSLKIYGDPTVRKFNDFDFLIDEEYFLSALKLLLTLGYKIQEHGVPNNNCKMKLWYEYTNNIILYNPDKNRIIELHHRLFKQEIITKEKWKDLIKEHTNIIKFQQRNFQVFDHEFELIYLLIHGGLHFWGRLKWLIDIKKMIDCFHLNETKFIRIKEITKAHNVINVYNALIKGYFPDSKPLPSANEDFLEKEISYALKNINSSELIIPNDSQTYLQHYIHRIRLFPSYRYKLSIIKGLLFDTDLLQKKWMPCLRIVNYIIAPFWKLINRILLKSRRK